MRIHLVALGAIGMALLLTGPAATQAKAAEVLSGSAITGEPLGVATVSVSLATAIDFRPDQRTFEIKEKNARVLYPVYATGDSVLHSVPVAEVTALDVHFLFSGTEPLQLELLVNGSETCRYTLAVNSDADAYRPELERWWKRYARGAREAILSADYPDQLDRYLAEMLPRRFDLERIELPPPWSASRWLQSGLDLFTGSESVRLAMQPDAVLTLTDRGQPADRDLPVAVRPPAVPLAPVPDDVAVEPIAMHVPAECFYLRCGSFENFQWLRAQTDDWSAGPSRLFSLRGFNYELNARLERQLALRQTTLVNVLGSRALSDIAIIGTDPFLDTGAALGVLFESRNHELTRTYLLQMRHEALRGADVVEQTIEIAGHQVSFVSSPDHRVRSFYASSGDYFLVTNSHYLVKRFFDAAAGTDSLGALEEFRHARSVVPSSREDTAFLYLSDPFFAQLVSPHYRVEMTRRAIARAELETAHLARLAARVEGAATDSIEALIAGGFLPTGFGIRADGSRVEMTAAGPSDTLRGARGSFLPIPDVEIQKITAAEHDAYLNFARNYRRLWQRMDPVIVAVSRHDAGAGNNEQITVDVKVTPYAGQHYALLASFLAPPDTQRLAPVPGDLVALQARLRANGLFGGSDPEDHAAGHGFAGLHDGDAPLAIRDAKIDWQPWFNGLPTYLGTDSLAWLLVAAPARVDNEQRSRSERTPVLQSPQGFRIEAASRELMESVMPHLRLEETLRPAQLRLHVGTLSGSRLYPSLTTAAYLQARKASAGNVRLLHRLIEQLHVPPQYAALVAEKLLDAKLVCPLDGKYELQSAGGGADSWRSTAWQEGSVYDVSAAPPGYRFAPLDALGGLQLELSLDETTLSVHIEAELNVGQAAAAGR